MTSKLCRSPLWQAITIYLKGNGFINHFSCSCSSYCYNSQLSKDQVAYWSDPPKDLSATKLPDFTGLFAWYVVEAGKNILPSHFWRVKDLDVMRSCNSWQSVTALEPLFSKQQDSVFYAETFWWKIAVFFLWNSNEEKLWILFCFEVFWYFIENPTLGFGLFPTNGTDREGICL